MKWPISRLRVFVAVLALGALVGAGVEFAPAGARDDPGPEGSVLAVPTLDPGKARAAAVDYLVGKGLSAAEAELRLARQPAQVAAAGRIRERAPGDVQAVWIDDGGRLVANVVNANGRKVARQEGAVARSVPYAGSDLQAVIDELAADALRNPPANFTGASFEIDDKENKIHARYMFKAAGGKIPKLAYKHRDTVVPSAEVAMVTTTAQVLPGQTISLQLQSNSVCSVGWALDIAANGATPKPGFLTAGHCFSRNRPAENQHFDVDTTDAGDTVGTGVDWVFGPAGDYGFVQLRDSDEALPEIRNTGQDTKYVRAIRQDPVVGATVCHKTRVRGEKCGKVLRTNLTYITRHGRANYLVKGQVRADYCAEGGDSGGPVYSPYQDDLGATGVAAVGIQASAILHRVVKNWVEDRVCGEYANPRKPNESDFTPLSNIDTGNKFFVKIAGG